MATFVRQIKLEDKSAIDISQITEFGFATWDFISSISKSGWDRLTANKDNRLFRQCIALQFKTKTSGNKSNINQKATKSSDKANISRISLPIPSRLSKKVFQILQKQTIFL